LSSSPCRLSFIARLVRGRIPNEGWRGMH
jgi:hypothetical protein